MQQVPATACERCGHPLEDGQLDCVNCGALVYQRRLEELANQALRLEQINPPAAALVWRQALDLTPPQSPQYQQVQYRIDTLNAGWGPAQTAQPQAAPTLEYEHEVRPPDPWPVAMTKTIGSMLVAAVVYYFYPFHDLVVALGFVVLMLIHEMGHVLAMRYYGLSGSPPIFIPFIGAVINLRERPPNALVESVIGMGGPFVGTIGAFACYGLAYLTHNPILQDELLEVAYLAFLLNLFNLLPVPPLDGGRITAAVSPLLWVPGLVGLGVMMYWALREQGGRFNFFILLMILLYALPRIRATLRAKGMKIPYYNVSRVASVAMGTLYIGLGLLLFSMLKGFGWFKPLLGG